MKKAKKAKKSSSEFGKGLVICLVKFSEHFMKLGSDRALYRKMKRKDGKDLFTDDHAVQMWANGSFRSSLRD